MERSDYDVRRRPVDFDRRRVQRNLRVPPQLAERVTAYAAGLGVSDNTGYILLVTAALNEHDRRTDDAA